MERNNNLHLVDKLRASKENMEDFIKILAMFPSSYYKEIYFSTIVTGKDVLVSRPVIKGKSIHVTLVNNEQRKDAKGKETDIALYQELQNEVFENIISTVEASAIRDDEARRKEEETTHIQRIIDEFEYRKIENEL